MSSLEESLDPDTLYLEGERESVGLQIHFEEATVDQ